MSNEPSLPPDPENNRPPVSKERIARLGEIGIFSSVAGAVGYVQTVFLIPHAAPESVSESIAYGAAAAIGLGWYCLDKAAKLEEARE